MLLLSTPAAGQGGSGVACNHHPGSGSPPGQSLSKTKESEAGGMSDSDMDADMDDGSNLKDLSRLLPDERRKALR